MSMEPLDVTFFPNRLEFHTWLEKHHDTRDALWVGYWKKATKKESVTWEETVDVALCFGWIDGIRKRVDEEAYTIRFTPRRPDSVWSLRNVERYAAMRDAGKVHAAGEAAWEKRKAEKTGVYGYEPGAGGTQKKRKFDELSEEWMQCIRDAGALAAWEDRAPYWRRQSAHYVMSAKRQETKVRRIERVIADLLNPA